MRKFLLLLLILGTAKINAQTCATGGCAATATNSTGHYPTATFSTTSSSWSTVSAFMNGGNYTLFDVTSGDTYEWTYCSDFGGSMGWDAELTLFNNANGTTLCYQNDCGRSSCSTAPYIRWTATFTGIVKLLTTVSGCGINSNSPYSKLVWRDTSGTPPAPKILGVDVYSGNSTINWSQVKAAGYTFAWAKATEGVGYTDSEYLNYAVAGVNAGLKMGAYHFIRADLNPTKAGAINEANYFLSVAQPYITSCELPPAIDVEGSYLSNFSDSALTAWIQNWITTVQTATGIAPVIYINATNASRINSSLNTYKLWIDYLSEDSTSIPPNTGIFPTWTINQYSWTRTVPGIAGNQANDVNVFNGNMTAFNNFIGCTTTAINQNNLNYAFAIYPNPASSNFHIDYSEDIGAITISVYNINGEVVLNQNITGNATIDISALSEGIYNINIVSNKGAVNKKLIIVH
ncbi:MAG TPA: GH25 family lysozyme [Bacteroidia bacterium]|jgi:GH25 family lysozyme M1 (1,4-beta-N-acetylmuramidase)|nr:GH25 family lysozyme [Bacteroidia bacterium]